MQGREGTINRRLGGSRKTDGPPLHPLGVMFAALSTLALGREAQLFIEEEDLPDDSPALVGDEQDVGPT